MNSQAIVVEVFRALERAGEVPSVGRVRAMARAGGANFSNEQASKWLEKFVKPGSEIRGSGGRFQGRGPKTDRSQDRSADRRPDRNADRDSSTNRTEARTDAQTEGETEERTASRARGLGNPIESVTLPLLTTFVAEPAKTQHDEPKREAKQSRFSDPIEDRAREILSAFWPRVEVAVARSITQTEWRSRNKKTARNLAEVGRSDAELFAAHASAARRMRVTPYMLSIVVDELIRLDNPQPERTLAASGGYERPRGPYDRVPATPRPDQMR